MRTKPYIRFAISVKNTATVSWKSPLAAINL